MHSLIKVNYTTLDYPCGEGMWLGRCSLGR